ncbi:uncharacterized protein F5Z01DRAFT_198915 [Emericellopsis atlantica]|uniref:Glycoside hydrolase 131 catalytic N-terminal domain-containing protein n=1 Tax=Emericellopsis atlantica TaxID=2614577 RepID=A0A9P7ZUB7_9HYPO|nr:uncharacterized protein F5Z01DRAFT_198915 [Emericellopsis atlantica]KAG9258488.1 hypothetical protein F5Z01DRAFT_198915 [Emericellopsis atlantica]
MKSLSILATATLTSAAVLWDGRLNDLESAEDLNKWSWATPVGPYQYYIHGNGPVTEYVEFSPEHKNPNDTASAQGVKITLTDTAYWNGQNMRRTELIPETDAAIASGKVWYHFSISRSATNRPSQAREHQIAFFENHFTELKYGGSGTAADSLRWQVSGQDKWAIAFGDDVWHNIAYEIDFAGGSVGLWHSTGAEPLQEVVAPMSVGASSNGADWHVGVLELPNGNADADEDLFFSGVYIENGAITTDVSGP